METIVGKALEKEADRRYASAAALAEDVERYLTSQPIQARPPSAMYQLRKFAGRNRVLVGGVLATMAMLVVGIVGTTFGMVRAQQQREIAEAERTDAQIESERAKAVADFLKYGFGFVSPRKDAGAELTVREMLDRATEDIPYVFEGRPAAEASVRAMLGDTLHNLEAYADAAEQLDLAAELMEAEIAKPDSSDLWELLLVDILGLRQITERNLQGEGGEKMLALYRRIYTGCLRLARERTPEFVEPLERMVEMTEHKEAPDVNEWLAILDDISRIHQELGPSADPKGVRAAFGIVGVAKTHVNNVLGFRDDGNASWRLANELAHDSPYSSPGERAMFLWLLIITEAETPERSLELSEELQEINVRLYPPNHWRRRVRDPFWHGDVLRRLGRHQEAEEIMLPLYANEVAMWGPTGYNVPFHASRIMLLYDDWGRRDKLAAFQGKVELSGDSAAMRLFLGAKSKAEATGG